MTKTLLVSALENGTVIDHIPCDRTNDVITLLKLNQLTSTVMIGYNLESKKMGKKSIIKIANKFFNDAELNQLAVIAPDVSLSIIRNYEVTEKKRVELPEELRDIVKCANPKCITNNEPMHTIFHIIDKHSRVMRCHYCEKEQRIEDAKLK
ncbi:MAG: aspartate carbamoyltransferase regulatory subunit [Bacteroidaceae bacterium]|nr:aspartate carbamoyltransferase regulatory subunit [Bacteroidaceae bacterium]